MPFSLARCTFIFSFLVSKNVDSVNSHLRFFPKECRKVFLKKRACFFLPHHFQYFRLTRIPCMGSTPLITKEHDRSQTLKKKQVGDYSYFGTTLKPAGLRAKTQHLRDTTDRRLHLQTTPHLKPFSPGEDESQITSWTLFSFNMIAVHVAFLICEQLHAYGIF